MMTFSERKNEYSSPRRHDSDSTNPNIWPNIWPNLRIFEKNQQICRRIFEYSDSPESKFRSLMTLSHIFCLQVRLVRFGTGCNVSGSSFKLYKQPQSTPRKPSTYKLLNLKCPKQSSKLFLTMRNQSSTKSQVQFIQKGGKSRKTMSSPPSGQCRLLILISHRYSSY